MSEGRGWAARGGGDGGVGQQLKPRASTAGSISEFEKALLFLETEVRPVFESREDVDIIDQIARNRQDARVALMSSKADLKAAIQRLENALREAKARVKMLSDSAVAESELAELSGRCAALENQARACDEAVERAKVDWNDLEAECRSAEDAEIRADIARERTVPELRTIVTLLAAATNALFEREGTRCRLLR